MTTGTQRSRLGLEGRIHYTYDYDDAFRLTSAQYPNAPSESFTYDQIGRRQPGTGAPWTYTAQGAVLSTGAATYTYDVDGNRRTKTEGGITTTYVYDEANKLIQVERPTGTVVSRYGYDPFGRRLWKEVGGVRTYFYYDEDGLAGELDSTGAVTKTYLFPPKASSRPRR
jgi:YD repeat-containing protein